MNRKKTKKVALVTGGCGFIGCHLVERLLKNRFEVVIIDNLSSGKKINIKETKKMVRTYYSSVQKIKLSKIKRPDVVFHLAAQASVPLSCKRMYHSSKNNLLSSIKMIEFCCKENIPFVYASSSAVYGNLSFGSECGKTELLSPYSVDKYVLEIYTSMAAKTFHLNSFGLRFFNVYGPRQDPRNPYSGVISIFADQIKKHRCIRINGGTQTRDFIHVSDIVQALIQAFVFLQKNSGAFVSNVLTGRSVSINKLADLCQKKAGYKVQKQYFPLSVGDPKQSQGSLRTMLSTLKMRPKIRLEDGLRDTIFKEGN